jgi:hypothetical protein
VPFGYRKKGEGKLELGPETAPIPCRIFEPGGQSESLRSTARGPNGYGVDPNREKKWHASTFRYVLNNRKYDRRLSHSFGEETVERGKPSTFTSDDAPLRGFAKKVPFSLKRSRRPTNRAGEFNLSGPTEAGITFARILATDIYEGQWHLIETVRLQTVDGM